MPARRFQPEKQIWPPLGLDDPKTQVTVTLKSGESHTISFGNELASGYFDYAILDKTGTIYSVSSSTIAKAKLAITDLLDKEQVIGIEDADLTGMVF